LSCNPPIAASGETASASQVFPEGPIVRACWCGRGDEPWVCPFANKIRGCSKGSRGKNQKLQEVKLRRNLDEVLSSKVRRLVTRRRLGCNSQWAWER
jgi:hypothetical protein